MAAYLSFVGDDKNRVINVYNEYKTQINEVILLYQPHYSDTALETKRKMEIDGKQVYVQEVFLENPDALQEVFETVRDVCTNLFSKDGFNKQDKIINITAGTRSIAVSWILLNQSDYLLNARLVQYIKPVISKDKDSLNDTEVSQNNYFCREVNFASIKGFPTISRINYLENKIREYEQPLKSSIIGNSKPIIELRDKISRFAEYDSPVLILGPTGTGKELTAEEIHNKSSRRANGFEKINCGAIPSELIESELFGYKKGAFTGALNDKVGYFENADKGTIFLDEVADLPLDAQVKLLRVLNDGEIRPVGGKVKIVDVRIISATNKDLRTLIKDGQFREDLYYRLNVLTLAVPPLKNRGDDIEILVRYMIIKKNEKNSKRNQNSVKNKQISAEALALLKNHTWPGNVRELDSVIERAFVYSDEIILPEHIMIDDIHDENNSKGETQIERSNFKEVKMFTYNNALGKNKLNASSAAQSIGINPHAFRKQLHTWGREANITSKYSNIVLWLTMKH